MKEVALAHLLLAAGLLLPIPVTGQSAAPTAGAQQQGTGPAATLFGTVRTSGGVAVPGAAVQVTNLRSGKAWETFTDEKGKFSVPDAPAGRYHIEAHQLG